MKYEEQIIKHCINSLVAVLYSIKLFQTIHIKQDLKKKKKKKTPTCPVKRVEIEGLKD